MVRRLAGRNGCAVSIPDGGRGLQGRDGRMVAIPPNGLGGWKVGTGVWSRYRRVTEGSRAKTAESPRFRRVVGAWKAGMGEW